MSSQSSEVVESVPAVASGTKMSWPLDPVDKSAGPLVPWMFRSKCGPLGAPFPVVELLADAEPPTSIRLNKRGEATTAPARKRFLTIVPPVRTEAEMWIELMVESPSIRSNTPARAGHGP